MRLLIPAVLAAVVCTSDAQAADPLALMKSLDGLRKEVPAGETLSEQNGATIKDPDGTSFTLTRLAKAATRLGVKDNGDCLVLLTYLNDPDPKIRFIAASAIENVVHAFPEGMTANTALESTGHREMIRRFAKNLSGDENALERKTAVPRAEKEVLLLQEQLAALVTKELLLRDRRASDEELAAVQNTISKLENELESQLADDAPAVALQAAIELAKEHAKTHTIDLSKHYLFSVRLASKPGAAGKQAWELIWERNQKVDDDEIEFTVEMDKTVMRHRRG
jgi:hypothetical protein